MGHECSECIFVASRESIFVDKKTRERVSRKAVYIGTFTLPNWKGHLKFYLCLCSCGRVFVDYPHGYTEGGYLFFYCDNCETIIPIYCKKIYKESGIEKPSLLGSLWAMLRLRFDRRQNNKPKNPLNI